MPTKLVSKQTFDELETKLLEQQLYIDRLMDALDQYGNHSLKCAVRLYPQTTYAYNDPVTCTCGKNLVLIL